MVGNKGAFGFIYQVHDQVMTWPRMFFILLYISLPQFHDKRLTRVMVILGVRLTTYGIS